MPLPHADITEHYTPRQLYYAYYATLARLRILRHYAVYITLMLYLRHFTFITLRLPRLRH